MDTAAVPVALLRGLSFAYFRRSDTSRHLSCMNRKENNKHCLARILSKIRWCEYNVLISTSTKCHGEELLACRKRRTCAENEVKLGVGSALRWNINKQRKWWTGVKQREGGASVLVFLPNVSYFTTQFSDWFKTFWENFTGRRCFVLFYGLTSFLRAKRRVLPEPRSYLSIISLKLAPHW